MGWLKGTTRMEAPWLLLTLKIYSVFLHRSQAARFPLKCPLYFWHPWWKLDVLTCQWQVKGANFANYSSSIAMELKVSKAITWKWQNRRPETNKYFSRALFLKLQAAGINFEKLLGWTVFKNPNFSPFQSSSVLPIRDTCCFCYVILTSFL